MRLWSVLIVVILVIAGVFGLYQFALRSNLFYGSQPISTASEEIPISGSPDDVSTYLEVSTQDEANQANDEGGDLTHFSDDSSAAWAVQDAYDENGF